MDSLTVILLLSIGSFVFALLLVAFQSRVNSNQKVPFWIAAKFLQAIGSLILYIRSGETDLITIMLANNALLLGCAYEAWAIWVITGRQVSRRLHMYISFGIMAVCLSTLLFAPHNRNVVIFLLHSIFYFLPGWFLFSQTAAKTLLSAILGISYSITGVFFFLCSVVFLVFQGQAFPLYGAMIYEALPLVNFCMLLISGFIMMMLAKERSDIQLQEIQITLKRSEIQFQRIVETAIEGILTFDRDFNITFINRKMADMLGYTPEEVSGINFKEFIPADQLIDHEKQMSSRILGQDAVYERCLYRKDGKRHWFLVSAKATADDSGNFDGSFAMLTDIDDRKRMELMLEQSNRQLAELTRMDGLTGIANRRYFDEFLEHEYSRLKRSNSELSVILLDIDYFKAFNDYYGHVKGDDCLRQIGSILMNLINSSVDLVARYGGEEFACILPDTDIDSAVMTAEKIRRGIEELGILHKGSDVSDYVTASFGVVTVNSTTECSILEILTEVDRFLYQAKSFGRNRVEFR
ncbi:MAG TPA: diguanylate cyclase [Candidatus Nitrosocosmicus sp.]|nr:diguanylate cyclase [Candidatus Nitrosocosmicus sp.]